MIKAENFLEKFTNADSVTISVTNEEISSGVTEKISVLQDVSIAAAVGSDVPIFTAEHGKIDYWHSFGSSVMLQRFLRRYDLDEGTRAYNAFKIGLDTERHAITFAIDDENHYFKIQLEENNTTPIDFNAAEKVLNKVNSMRYNRLK